MSSVFPLEALHLKKVFRDFWHRPRTEAVSDVSLRVAPGEVVGILGPNGSGKSTTIKILLGLLRPDAGKIRLFGDAPDSARVRSRVGYLPEISTLHKFLTPRETLEYYASLFGMGRAERAVRVPALLERVGLADKATQNRPVGEFSKGMARRVGLAQALLNNPDLIVLDEPTSGLDPLGRHDVKVLIRELQKEGKTVLLSSHLLAEVADVCTRVCIFLSGRIVAEGALDALLEQRSQVCFTAEGLSEEAVSRVREVICREGADSVTVSHPSQTLERYFLEAIRKEQTERTVKGTEPL